jgi:hypothetical protein
MSINKREFNKSLSKYKEMEKRGSFYDMAVKLLNDKYEIEAYFLILATWNFAQFRYALKEFDIKKFKKTIRNLDSYFEKFQDQEFSTINFDDYEKEIKKIFSKLSSFNGIKYTGASKIMHLKNRGVFLMWDGYIKGDKVMRHYNELEIVKRGEWEVKRYESSEKGYFQFLKDMQDLFKHLDFEKRDKTFAKAIDEFNFANITLDIQKMEKIEAERKKKEKNKIKNLH